MDNKTAAIAGLVAIDIFLTRGQASAFLATAILLGNLHHNRSANEEQEQKRLTEFKSAATNIFVGVGTAVLVGGVYKLISTIKPVKVDLMGGSKSSYKDHINYDPKAVAGGINDEAKNFGKYFGKSTVTEIVVNNPQAIFLESVAPTLKSGGTITVRGTMSNKFFSSLYNNEAAGLKDFTITEMKPTQTTGFFRSDGQPIKGQIKQIRLTKK